VSIEIRDVNKQFGDFVALENINLSIPNGQLTALLGPSGGGKSTLLRIIAGLEFADSGQVDIDGVDATYLPPQKRNVGFVFQHYAAFKHMTVARNVAFGMEIRKRPKAEVKARVDELLRSSISHSSPSACRRNCRVVSVNGWHSPALSPSNRRCCSSMNRSAPSTRRSARSSASGCAACTTRFTSRQCCVTHDQEEALEVAESIVVINNGRIEQIGTPDELYDKPANDFVMSFLGPVTRLGETLVRPHDLELHHRRPRQRGSRQNHARHASRVRGAGRGRGGGPERVGHAHPNALPVARRGG
jgi:sulfate transport system ATP-binding protein